MKRLVALSALLTATAVAPALSQTAPSATVAPAGPGAAAAAPGGAAAAPPAAQGTAIKPGTAVAPAAPAAPAPPVAGAGPAWAAFSKLVDATPQYVETIVSSEAKGKAITNSTYKFSWMNPSNAKIEVVGGPSNGTVVVWTGGPQVQAHDGEHPGIVLPFDRTDKTVTSLRGNLVGSAAFSAIRTAFAANGPLTETSGPVVNGVPTTLVTMNPDPSKSNGVSKGQLYIAANGAPQRILLYEGTTAVEQDDFKNQNLTASLSARDFSL